MTAYHQTVVDHFVRQWRQNPNKLQPPAPRHRLIELGEYFAILEFPPGPVHDMWAYTTCGIGFGREADALELVMYSPEAAVSVIEVLTITAHYDITEQPLWFGHTVDFGMPWLHDSVCKYGLISFPHIEDPEIDIIVKDTICVRSAWLLPITTTEREYKIRNGVDALEKKLEKHKVNYLDPKRASVV